PRDVGNRSNAVLDRILDFASKWEGSLYLALAEQRPIGGFKTIDGETVPDIPDRSAFAHPIERALLRTLTSGTNFEIGSQGWHEFAWNGRVFRLGATADLTNLIEFEISPQTDQA